jgi:hypothetical protein
MRVDNQRLEPKPAPSFRGALVLLGVLAGGCFPRVAPPPGALSADPVAWGSSHWPGVTGEALAHGHDLFVGNCNRCHGYPDLAAIPDVRWPRLVEKMGKKSHLDAAGRDAVLHFILAYRSGGASR